jgi:prolyl-tRNA synthetase
MVFKVGHTFLLGDKYSKPLKATYLSSNGKPEVLQMGSYGLGLSRILAAAVEVLSSEQEIRWPPSLAPYNVIILPPKV